MRTSLLTTNKSQEIPLEEFGAFPSWIEIVYKDEGLSLWEAGCLWYSDDLFCPPLLQLRAHFATKETLYFLYSKEEILAHEAIHAIRAPLKSKRFEEYFAYSTSKSTFRKFLGPLFSTPTEASFVILASFIFFASAFLTPLLSAFGALTLFSLFFARLARNWYLFFKCKKRLSALTKKPLALMLRLTDEEILYFAKASVTEARRFIEEQKNKTFRWQLLFFLATHSEFWHARKPTIDEGSLC